MIKYLQLKKQSKYKINDICNKFNLESNSTLLSIYAFALAGFSKFIFTTAGQWPPQRGYFARITWLTIEFNDWESMIRSKRTLCHAILVWNHTCDFKSNECAITTLFHPCWNQIITNAFQSLVSQKFTKEEVSPCWSWLDTSNHNWCWSSWEASKPCWLYSLI